MNDVPEQVEKKVKESLAKARRKRRSIYLSRTSKQNLLGFIKSKGLEVEQVVTANSRLSEKTIRDIFNSDSSRRKFDRTTLAFLAETLESDEAELIETLKKQQVSLISAADDRSKKKKKSKVDDFPTEWRKLVNRSRGSVFFENDRAVMVRKWKGVLGGRVSFLLDKEIQYDRVLTPWLKEAADYGRERWALRKVLRKITEPKKFEIGLHLSTVPQAYAGIHSHLDKPENKLFRLEHLKDIQKAVSGVAKAKWTQFLCFHVAVISRDKNLIAVRKIADDKENAEWIATYREIGPLGSNLKHRRGSLSWWGKHLSVPWIRRFRLQRCIFFGLAIRVEDLSLHCVIVYRATEAAEEILENFENNPFISPPEYEAEAIPLGRRALKTLRRCMPKLEPVSKLAAAFAAISCCKTKREERHLQDSLDFFH